MPQLFNRIRTVRRAHPLLFAIFIAWAACAPSLSDARLCLKYVAQELGAPELGLPTSSSPPLRAQDLAHDTSVELEMDASPTVLSLLTTMDGTVGPLFQDKPLPGWFEELAQKRGYPGTRARQLPWTLLSDREQIRLINSSSEGQKFFDDRKIHGLKIVPTVTLEFKTPTRFMGRDWPAGKHEWETTGILNQVEYRGPKDIGKLRGVELHFRARGLADEVSTDASTFQKAKGLPVSHQHVHIVAPLRRDVLAANPKLETARRTDYVRRVHLALEFIKIMETEGTVKIKAGQDGAIYFAPLRERDYGRIADYFFGVAHSPEAAGLGSNIKGYLGVRGHDVYDQPDLWGIEFRALPKNADRNIYDSLLRTIQEGMTKDDYGISKSRMTAWSDRQNAYQHPATWMEKLAYNKKWGDLLPEAPEAIRNQYRDKEGGIERLMRFMSLVDDGAKTQDHIEIKMLFHDWSSDPMVFDNPPAQKRILDAQVSAIKALKEDPQISKQVMRKFLIESGLYDAVFDSIGVVRVPEAHPQ